MKKKTIECIFVAILLPTALVIELFRILRLTSGKFCSPHQRSNLKCRKFQDRILQIMILFLGHVKQYHRF